jgi:predicted NACHT family NTPase
MNPQTETTALIGPIIKAFNHISDEWSDFMEKGLGEYIYDQTNKYYYTKTFLHRAETVRFDEIYYHIKCQYRELKTDFSRLEEILDENKYITIIGSAGSGKTTLIKYIFLQSINQRARIPILIELRNLNEYNGSIEKLISDKILASKVKSNSAILKRTLRSGKFLFLLDGYDEIFSDKKQEINRQLEQFIDSYAENRFILTTRPGSGVESFSRFKNFKVLPLDEADVIGFINKIVEDDERKKRIITIVNSRENSNYLEFLKNPLLLSMFILAFESHPEIPGKKNAFYKNVFDTLYSKHDGITKNSFPREKKTKLKREDFETILSLFSFLSLMDGRYTFTSEYLAEKVNIIKAHYGYEIQTEDLIYDLHTAISMLILVF